MDSAGRSRVGLFISVSMGPDVLLVEVKLSDLIVVIKISLF